MKKILSVILSAAMLLSCCALSASAADAEEDATAETETTSANYTIDSPYEDVVWSGDGAWGAYKGNLHTHSFVSDGSVDFRDMVLEYYRQGYDFLAMTEHGVTGKNWNETPTKIPLYLYQYIIGNFTHKLTDEEYEGVTTGTYPVDGTARGYGMTCVAGGNELNALTLSKCHVNGLFLPEGVGDNHLGFENDHEGAVKIIQNAGGIAIINHPGDWLNSNSNAEAVSDPDNVKYFSDIILKYDSCYGMEVFNEKNSVTPHDRILWDNVLMNTLPYGKTVIGYSNSDAHSLDMVDSSFMIFMMKENNLDNIKETVKSGALFCVTRNLCADENLGPAEEIQARNTDLAYPEFTELSVDGHTITVKAKNCYNIQWVANGNVIASYDCEESEDEVTYVLDLDTIDGVEDFLYVRCQLLAEGGCTLSQALVLDHGTEPLTFEADNSVQAKLDSFVYRIQSLRIFVLIKIIADDLK